MVLLQAIGDAHAREGPAVAVLLDVDPARGLSSADAGERAAAAGPNTLEEQKRHSPWRMVLAAAAEPFVVLLLLAGVGAILLGEVRDGLLIVAGLIPIVGADVLTEYRGDRALDALRAASSPTARVRRNGAASEIAASEVVPGDVVLLRSGDVVAADIRLLRTDRLVIDRSVLTGESVPEAAAVEPDVRDAPLIDRRSIAYAGTSVLAGRGEGIVVATGTRTELGRIAAGLGPREARRSPLQRELDRLVRMLLVVAIGLIAITTGLGFLRGNTIGANLLAGISAAIAAIPEEPPVLLAVILGLGAYRLLKRGVLVRRLNAEEVLGAVDLVVTDKTGTLTQNRLEVASVRDLTGPVLDDTRRRSILEWALRAQDDAWGHEDGVGVGSFSQALIRAVQVAGGDAHPDALALLAAEPVGDGRPWTTTRARIDGCVETLVLGAPEAVADQADGDADERQHWHALIEAATSSGERLVAMARAVDDGPLAMVALVGFADPLRSGIREATAEAVEAGIQVIVVTGDHPATARAIADAAGIPSGRTVLGSDVASWTDAQLAAELPGLSVVARSTPDQKRRIVECARMAGRLVAVTGDGVNDAPALNQADVAVAMGSGTAVAKEAADLVLGDDSFATLIFGIAEGRRIVDNVQKGLVFLVSTHVMLLGFLLIATLAGFSQPLLPIQILWLELFIDLSTSVAFEREPPEPGLMSRRPRRPGVPLLTRDLLVRIGLGGGFTAVVVLWLMSTHDGGFDHARWLAYTSLVCAQAVRAYANRSLTEPLRRLGTNGFLLAAGIATIAVQAVIPAVPPLAEAFRATPLDALDWALVAGIALAPAVLAELVRERRRTAWVA